MKPPVKLTKKLEVLSKRVKTLRKLVHHKDCRREYDCPNFHFFCKPGLDLSTACAWEAAGKIRHFVASANHCFDYEIYSNDLYYYEIEIRTIRRILNYHRLNDKRMNRIYSQVENALDSIRNIRIYLSRRFEIRTG